jgi:hypothetical protein
MITIEMLQQQSALNGLTDEQRNAIVTLSKNDEEAVISKRFGEVYRQMDETIARETGIQRNGDEKTYVYLERAAREMATKVNSIAGLNTRISELTAERDRLKKAIEDGTGDEKLRKELSQAQKDLDSIKNQYNTLKADYDKQKNDHAAELINFRIDNEIASAQGGIKFKAELPETATSVLLAQAIGKIKAFKHEVIDDGKGGQMLRFLDENGAVMRNPENVMEPYTIAELLKRELKQMGVLDEGRQQPGIGSQPPVARTQDGNIVIDLAGVKSQNEAQEIIAQTLMKQGLTNGSKAFQEAMTQAWKDNNISALPIK